MTAACILFVLAALTAPLGRVSGKSGTALPFFCVLLCCAGAAVCILSRGTAAEAAAGVTAVALSCLLFGKGGGKK